MSFVERSAAIEPSMAVTFEGGAVVLSVPAAGPDARWASESVESAMQQMAQACGASPEIAMAIGDPDLIELLSTGEHPLSSPESQAANIAVLREVPALDMARLAEELNVDRPVLIDVWGPRCTSCVLMAPIVHELRERLAGKVDVLQVDGEADPAVREVLQAPALPTYLLYVGGERIAYWLGFRGVDVFERDVLAAVAMSLA